jgi:uncharacterized protein
MSNVREDFGDPKDAVKGKIRDYMCEATQAFITASPFLILATADGEGNCDASPKGGAPGFVKVLDKKRLLVPDIAGNKLFQGFENLETNPKAGLIFMIPGCDVTFRVNGRATRVTKSEEKLKGINVEAFFSDENTKILQGTLIEVEETYIHCPRAFLFSEFWNTQTIAENREGNATANWSQRWRKTFG